MKPAVLTAATLACAYAGWWLPSLWQEKNPRPARRILPLPDGPRAVATTDSLANAVSHAGNAMAQFHAVAAAVDGRGAGLARSGTDAFVGLACEEAEELAARLAGEEFARAFAGDGVAFLRSLDDLDFYARYSALTTWADARPAEALRMILTPEGDQYIHSSIFDSLVKRDPAQALEIIRATPVDGNSTYVWGQFLSAIAVENPDSALAALQSAPSSLRGQCVKSMLSAMAGIDPRAALQWAEQLPPELRTGHAAVYERWSKDDPAAAAAHWLTADPESLKSQGDSVIREWTKQDPDAALRWAEENGVNISDDSRQEIFGAIATRDPQRAIALLSNLDPESRGAQLEGEIAERWAATDFPAAFQWVAGLMDPTAREFALAHLQEVVKTKSEAEQRAFIAAAGPGNRIGWYVLHGLNPNEALQSFAAFNPQEQLVAWKYLTSRQNNESPEQIAPLLRLMLVNGPDDASEASELAARWSIQDPDAAASWVENLPQGKAQQWATANVAANWGRHDPVAASVWLEGLAEGPAKDLARKQFAALTAPGP